MKLEKLNKKQLNLIPKIRQKYLDRFFNLEYDETKMKEFVDFIYLDICKLKKPIKIVIDSPLGVQFAFNMLKQNQVNDQVSSQVSGQVDNQVSIQVRNQVWRQVWDQVEDQVWNQVRNQVRNQVW